LLSLLSFVSIQKAQHHPLGHPKQSQGFSMTSNQQRAALQSQIWEIANDVRGAVDGWDFKQYVLGTLFYRFISENFAAYIEAGDDSIKPKATAFALTKLKPNQ